MTKKINIIALSCSAIILYACTAHSQPAVIKAGELRLYETASDTSPVIIDKDKADSYVKGPLSSTNGNLLQFTNTTGRQVGDTGVPASLLGSASGNKFVASPANGSSGALAQRAIVDADIPSEIARDSEVSAVISDAAYSESTWDGVTGVAPSKNAVRDKFESVATDITAKADDSAVVKLAGSQTVTGDKKLTGSTEFERVSGDGPLIDVDANNAAVLQIEGQVDAVDWFNATITTVPPGDGAVVGPRASGDGDGWLFVGMVRVRINGSYFYMPYYSPDI